MDGACRCHFIWDKTCHVMEVGGRGGEGGEGGGGGQPS